MTKLRPPTEWMQEVIEKKGKLPAAFKRKWVKALRSGKYKQGKSYLRQTDEIESTHSYCCLGVACDLVGKTDRFFGGFTTTRDGYISKKALIPMNVREIPLILRGGEQSAEPAANDVVLFLASENDRGTSFDDIADWVEKHL